MSEWRKQLGTVLALLVMAALPALPARAQISSKQMRDRYERQTKGTNINDHVRKLQSEDAEKRLEGVKLLEESKEPKAIEHLVGALADPDMRVKAKAIDALGTLRATDAAPVLVQQLFLRDTEASVKRRILASLGKIGDPRSAGSIAEFLRRDLDPGIRGTAIFALGEIGAPESVALLQEIESKEENPTLRRLAGEAVAKIRHHQAVLKVEARQPQATFLKDERVPPQ